MSGMTLLFYIVLTAGTLILRTYLQLWGIDTNTGFYLNNTAAIVTFNLLLALTVALLLILPRLKSIKGYFTAGKLNSITKIFLGFVVEVVAFTDFIELLFGNHSEKNTNVLLLASIIMSVVAGLAFVFDGFSTLSDQKKTQQSLLGAAIPPVWMIVVLLKTFMSYKLSIEISDNMLHILAMVFVLLFFTAYAKLSLDAGTGYTINWTVSTGLLASFFCLTLSLPRLISGALGASFAEGPTTSGTLIVLTLGVYSLLAVLNLTKK